MILLVTNSQEAAMPLDAVGSMTRLVRPRLLARAARDGATLYRRERDLAGLGLGAVRAIVPALETAEAVCEAERLAGAAHYSPARHVRVLSALLAEARAATL